MEDILIAVSMRKGLLSGGCRGETGGTLIDCGLGAGLNS